MAGTSFFTGILRRCVSRNPSSTTGALSTGCFLRTVSSGPMRSADAGEVPTSLALPEDSLRDRIFRLRFPKRSATVALEKWVGEGWNVTAGELRRISRELRRAQRYKHALEISEWMISHHERELSTNDYAVRIGLISKVFGVASAEEFFEGLPSTAKTCETYTALLHAYASAKLVEKAEFLFDKMKALRITINTLTFNEMMTLYISVGQAEKVPLVVEQLKSSSESADIFTYNLWISAYASTMDIDGVRRILDEMSCDPNGDNGWKTYIKLTDIYISTSHLTNMTHSPVEAKNITQRMITYDFLVILYTGLGNKEQIDEIWKSLQMTFKKIANRTYVCILSSYLMHAHLKEAGEILDQWKKEKDSELGNSICDWLYNAFLKVDLTSVAETFHQLLSERNPELLDVPEKS